MAAAAKFSNQPLPESKKVEYGICLMKPPKIKPPKNDVLVGSFNSRVIDSLNFAGAMGSRRQAHDSLKRWGSWQPGRAEFR